MPNQLTFAVPKGRILAEALPVMARAGVVPEASFHDKVERALSFATEDGAMRIIRVRAFDVATFVANGAAQAGIVGSDVVEEFDYPELYAPVDLDIGHCRLSVAQPQGAELEPAEPTLSVSELSDRIGYAVRSAFHDEVWVRGEIRDLNRARSGHVYFTLIDPDVEGTSCLSVMLSDRAKGPVNRSLRMAGDAVRMTDGTEVRIRGRVDWYGPRGQLQLRMTAIDPAYTLGHQFKGEGLDSRWDDPNCRSSFVGRFAL